MKSAGGQTKRDLFADEDGNGVFITNADLLNRLVNEKLQQIAATIQSEGWRWVEIHPDADYSTLAKFRRIPGEPEPLPRKSKASVKLFRRNWIPLPSSLMAMKTKPRNARTCLRPHPADRNRSGRDQEQPRRQLSRNGEADLRCHRVARFQRQGAIHPGLLRKEDEAATRAAQAKTAPTAGASDEALKEAQKPRTGYSAALIQSLTTTKTAAIAAELASQPRIALATVVYTMILQEFSFELDSYKWHSSSNFPCTHTDLREAEESLPGKAAQ